MDELQHHNLRNLPYCLVRRLATILFHEHLVHFISQDFTPHAIPEHKIYQKSRMVEDLQWKEDISPTCRKSKPGGRSLALRLPH